MKYRTIVADPPWPYGKDGFAAPGTNHLIRGRRRTPEERGPTTRASLPYATMELGEIAGLPIASLAGSDARLFLWTTNRFLPTALSMLSPWGFSYRQLIVWDKTPNFNPLAGGVAAIATEFLVVASRGAPGLKERWPTSIIRARKARTTHSTKPDVFLDFVETVSPGPYLELFARRQRLGWDTWGLEALEHVTLETA